MEKRYHKHTIKQIVFLGGFFLFLTLTYSSFSTIITYIYEHHDGYEHLGPVLLIANYGTFMLCNILAPFVKISYKKQLIIGAICYTINYAIEIPVILSPFGVFLLILGSVLGGLGAAIVWVSQGGFMTGLFDKYHRPSHYHGRYWGLLNGIVFSNILLGSCVTTFGLGFMGDTEYFMILTALGGVSILFGTFLLEDVQDQKTAYFHFA